MQKNVKNPFTLFPLPFSLPGAAVVTVWGLCPGLLYVHLLTWALLYVKPSTGSCSSCCSAASFFH